MCVHGYMVVSSPVSLTSRLLGTRLVPSMDHLQVIAAGEERVGLQDWITLLYIQLHDVHMHSRTLQVKHYAGLVTYTTEGFMDKNKVKIWSSVTTRT